MAEFKMCEECKREYEDPLNRRFHTQPTACPVCGPSLFLYDKKKKVKSLKRTLRENYVKLGMVKKIIAAWVITVPAAATLSAIIFYVIKGFN